MNTKYDKEAQQWMLQKSNYSWSAESEAKLESDFFNNDIVRAVCGCVVAIMFFALITTMMYL